ncbi:putative LRR receptor-like serine/threonine-protein kinase isoform X2 [Iris pallida]|uniref:non-specific serine/threonine protein kinase n=1 Tax=Iris pallida TaxID=29817 RepID=A0AAX6ECQ2_IRIPA|nr:putative LRR receptor-like serine/threonine-protein kinase isoform X2 [Iris pallida]
MLGTSLEGPFPPIFATLSSITQLSVSDWKGGDGKFPPLQNMKGMEYLYLRNLSISGQLPDYIGSMNKLDTLDISFNNLSGTIPGTFVGLQSTSYIFLTNNMLQGSIPHWILSSKYNLDVSYNNFTGTPAPPDCQQGNVNLMSSYSSTDNSISPCLQRNFPCSKKPRNYKLFINCGGSKVTSNDNEYEDDSSPLGAARYAISEKIMFTDDDTFSSLGRRLFDVSIQSQKVLYDFDIVKEANGTGKGIIKTFTASVDGTLEIDLYWAGKGTTAFPRRSVYGPLISAISVTPNFNPTTSDGKISLGAIVGIVVSVCVLILLLLLAILWIYLRRKNSKRSGPERSRLNLNWQTRRKICLGIAKGLTYLHEESTLKIVHRDIKSTNVLLDRDLKAKISDFGLAKLHEEENTHISTRIAGTSGYMAPEYAMRGYLTDKADVYSFGIVMLEIVSSTANSNYRPKEDMMCLVDWANILAERGSLLELVDPKLESSYSKEEALQMLNLVLLCTNPSPSARPLMSTVVSMLEGKIPVHLPPLNPSASKLDDTRPKTFEKLSHDSQLTSGSVDDSWTDSSAYHVSRIESAILSESRSHSDNVD